MTWRMAIVCGCAWLSLGVQAPEPAKYPPGWFCSPRGTIKHGEQTPDNPCRCKRMNSSKDCDDPTHDTHDRACSQFCSEEHCACGVTCEPGGAT